MTTTDRPRFLSLVNALAEAFRRDVTEALVEAYWIALKDLELEAVEQGASLALRECRFMPAPAEIRERATGANAVDAAEAAWETLLAAVRNLGGGPDVEFQDGRIGRVVERMGGWGHVTGLESEELLKWARKDFLRGYAAEIRSGCPSQPHVVRGLLGIGEPVQIGSPPRALTGGAARLPGSLEGAMERIGALDDDE